MLPIVSNPAPEPLDILKFEGEPVRYLVRDGYPWLVARDLASPLGISVRGMRKAVSELPEEDWGELLVPPPAGSFGAPVRVQIVSESGSYQVIFQGRKPVAKRLRKWVADLAVKVGRGQVFDARALADLEAMVRRQSEEIGELRGFLAQIASGMSTFNRVPLASGWPEDYLPPDPAGLLSPALLEEFLEAKDGFWFGPVATLAELLATRPTTLTKFFMVASPIRGIYVELITRGKDRKKYVGLELERAS